MPTITPMMNLPMRYLLLAPPTPPWSRSGVDQAWPDGRASPVKERHAEPTAGSQCGAPGPILGRL